MNAIILEPIRATLSPSDATITLALNAAEALGWKTEAQRLALGANSRLRLCCTEEGSGSAGTQFPLPNLLFTRYGHSSGVRTPASG
jgi:hypothetical protein